MLLDLDSNLLHSKYNLGFTMKKQTNIRLEAAARDQLQSIADRHSVSTAAIVHSLVYWLADDAAADDSPASLRRAIDARASFLLSARLEQQALDFATRLADSESRLDAIVATLENRLEIANTDQLGRLETRLLAMVNALQTRLDRLVVPSLSRVQDIERRLNQIDGKLLAIAAPAVPAASIEPEPEPTPIAKTQGNILTVAQFAKVAKVAATTIRRHIKDGSFDRRYLGYYLFHSDGPDYLISEQ